MLTNGRLTLILRMNVYTSVCMNHIAALPALRTSGRNVLSGAAVRFSVTGFPINYFVSSDALHMAYAEMFLPFL